MYKSSKVILVAFADGPFLNRKRQFVHEAKSMDIFDEILFFDSSMLESKFKAAHLHFMQAQKRGLGYWIWKPEVIRMAVQHSNPNDLIVYLDAGFTLNPMGRSRFLEYLDITLDSPFKMLSFQNVHTECVWTKADLAKRLGIEMSSHIMLTSQLASGFLIFANTQSNRDLILQWRDIAVEDGYRFSDDSPSVEKNHPQFKEHRHDQSISSLLRKQRGTTITYYEVQEYGTFKEQQSKLPAWATRLKS